MSAAQSPKKYEVLTLPFVQPEMARQFVEDNQALVVSKVGEGLVYKPLWNKDLEALRQEMRTNLVAKQDLVQSSSSFEAGIDEMKVGLLRWMMLLFMPFYVGMIVFLIKQFV